MALVVFAAYLLISQLAQIGFGTIADELGNADLAWVIVALVLAQCTFIGSGISVRGAVATPLALLPCVVLQSAIKFINLTVPSSAGRIGMNLRFLQRMGAQPARHWPPAPSTTCPRRWCRRSAPPCDPARRRRHRHEPIQGSGTGSAPAGRHRRRRRHRRRDRPRGAEGARQGRPADPNRPLEPLERGQDPPQARRAVRRQHPLRAALRRLPGATCLAYGVNLNLAQLIFVNTSASVLSSVIPVPGGIGAAEAALAAGLISMGVDESTAFAIALTQRLCTFYLPPIWGYFSLRWLTRKGYL